MTGQSSGCSGWLDGCYFAPAGFVAGGCAGAATAPFPRAGSSSRTTMTTSTGVSSAAAPFEGATSVPSWTGDCGWVDGADGADGTDCRDRATDSLVGAWTCRVPPAAG